MTRPLHIALVDDDRVYQFTTERMLQRIDQEIAFRWFRDGEEALSFLKTHALDAQSLPDVMILDINMPFMDGWQFLEAFRDLRQSMAKPIDIYMVSSSADERDQLRALATGDVADYLEKPITSDILRDLVSRYGRSDDTLH
jgi:CheY-like chemotaxis protein